MRVIIISIVAFCYFITPTFAQDQNSDVGDFAERAAVVTDENRGIISFIIEGREIMRLDATGLYISDDITYGGTLTDAGSTWVEDRIAEGRDDE